jgi:hypothetical protein
MLNLLSLQLIALLPLPASAKPLKEFPITFGAEGTFTKKLGEFNFGFYLSNLTLASSSNVIFNFLKNDST